MKHGEALPIASIRVDGGTQPRAVLDFDAIEDYADAMGAGMQFPPVTVFYDGESYWLADGFHRIKAAYAAGFDTAACDIHQGTLEDAQWYSLGANRINGLRRTTEDKQRAVKAALVHGHGTALSDTRIARHVGVDQKTVTNWRRQLQASQEIPKMASRAVTRNGKVYQQNTSNIGKRKTPRSRARAAENATPSIAIPQQTGSGLDALLRGINTIAACGASPEEVAPLLAARPDRDQLTFLMEKTIDFLRICANETRRAGSVQQPANDTSVPGSQEGDDADHARSGPAMA